MSKRDSKTGLLIYLLVLLFHMHSLAIERGTATGAREAALSQAVVALGGSFSVFHNQAFLTESKTTLLGVCYRQPYFIPGYHECALSLVYPTSTAIFAIGVSQSAITVYRESNVGISIAKVLTRKLSAGILFNYFNLTFPEASCQRGSFQVDGGIGYKYSERLSLGFHIRNIAATKIETFQYNITFPLVIRGGATYRLTEIILLAVEIIDEQHYSPGIRCGTEYQVRDNFLIRGGISTNPFQHSFGFGYKWNFCLLDFAMVHHEILGYTPFLSFSFNLNR